MNGSGDGEKFNKKGANYNFCYSKVDNDSSLLVNSLLELIFVRSGSFSLGEDFADTDVQAMIALLCTA